MGKPGGRGEGTERSVWEKECVGNWWQLGLSLLPPTCSPVLPWAGLLWIIPGNYPENRGCPWLVSSFLWWASLMTGQMQPWSKWGWETPGTEFCGDGCFTSCPSSLEVIRQKYGCSGHEAHRLHTCDPQPQCLGCLWHVLLARDGAGGFIMAMQWAKNSDLPTTYIHSLHQID